VRARMGKEQESNESETRQTKGVKEKVS